MTEQTERREDFIRLPEVMRRSGLSRSEIYRRMAANTFPKSHRLGHRTACWTVGEIDDWKADVRLKDLL